MLAVGAPDTDSSDNGSADNKENEQEKKFNENENTERYRPTLSQDSLHYKHIATFSPNHARTVVVTVDLKTEGDFTQFKLFKKFPETGFFQRAQQISLRTIEAERVIIQLPVFVEKATKYILNGVRPITQTLEASLDEHTDFGNAQWNLDVSRSSTRLVRVSLLTYDVTQPLISTYFQRTMGHYNTSGTRRLGERTQNCATRT